jgi:ABC-type sugar transport system substrate-binding protein
MKRTRSLLTAAALLALALLLPVLAAAAQQTGAPQPSAVSPQNLRPYWHVFIAYAIAIVLVGGWAVSIARRLRDVEDRLLD